MKRLDEIAPGLWQNHTRKPEPDPYPSETPKLRPYISTKFDGVPKLFYVNADGRPVSLNLCKHDLLHLALSIENACETITHNRIRDAADLAERQVAEFYDHKVISVP